MRHSILLLHILFETVKISWFTFPEISKIISNLVFGITYPRRQRLQMTENSLQTGI